MRSVRRFLRRLVRRSSTFIEFLGRDGMRARLISVFEAQGSCLLEKQVPSLLCLATFFAVCLGGSGPGCLLVVVEEQVIDRAHLDQQFVAAAEQVFDPASIG